jgi:hypothetical protein
MNYEIILLLSLFLFFIVGLLGIFKKLRNDKNIRILIIITVLIAIYPLKLKLENAPYFGYMRVTDCLFLPFFYVSTYGLLRLIYKRIYKREPTYYRQSWFDPEDNREQNWFDMFVYIGSMFLPIIYVVLMQ